MKRLLFPALLALSLPAYGQSPLDGIWQTDGYGLVAEIADGRARTFQIAGDVCLPMEGWERLSRTLEGVDVSLAPDGRTAYLIAPHAQHRIAATRLSSLPQACTTPLPDTPIANFEAFAAVFAHSYAFFDLYGVDWDATVAQARPRVTADLPAEALFRLFAEMIAPLRDGHIELEAQIGRREISFEPNPGRTHLALTAGHPDREEAIDGFHEAFWRGSVAQAVLGGQGEMTLNRRMQYGLIGGDVGYIALVTMGDYTRRGIDADRDLAAVDAAMEEALQSFAQAGVRAVIVDASVNYGGFDFVSRAVAERFAASPVHAYTKYAGDAVAPIRTQVQLTPSQGTRFTGPVYLLTSNITISAGEILTLAMRSLPNVTHVGEPTRGAFSDVLDRELPNGWEVSLSNEVYEDPEGRVWEGRGITPDVAMTVFPDADPIAGHRAAINAILAMIR